MSERRCMFCEKNAASVEDVTPQWIRPLVENTNRASRMQLWIRDSKVREWFGRKGLRLKRFCRRCNNHWMSDLETKARQIIGPLILDISRPLEEDEQRLVALWGTKTAMVLDGINSNTDQWFYSPEDRRLLLGAATPPPRTMIWIGRSAQSHSSFFEGRWLHPSDQDILREGHVMTLAIARFVIQILTIRLKREDQSVRVTLHIRPGPWDQRRVSNSLIAVWPVGKGRVFWPPVTSFDEVGVSLEHLSERFRAG